MKHKYSITRISKYEFIISNVSPTGLLVSIGTYAASPMKAWNFALADMRAMGWTLPVDKPNGTFLVQISCFDSNGFIQGDTILEKLKSFCFLNIIACYDRYASRWQKANESEEFPTMIVEMK